MADIRDGIVGIGFSLQHRQTYRPLLIIY